MVQRGDFPLRQCWMVYEILYRVNHEKHEKGGKRNTHDLDEIQEGSTKWGLSLKCVLDSI